MINSYTLMLTCLFCVFSVASVEAREWRSWCGAEASSPLGWHFYCDPDEAKEPVAPATKAPQAPSAAERILSMRRALEEARAQAVLEPTPENVKAYLRLQQEALQSAAAFSDAFRRAVWANPGLDYTLRRPVGALAKRLWTEERRAEREGVLQGSGSATASSTWARSGVPAAAYSGPSFGPSRCATGSRCSPYR